MAIPVQTDRRVFDQVASPSYARPFATPEQYGAGVGAAVAQLGGELGDIARHEKAKADAFAVADLDAAFSAETTKMLYDKDTGFMSKVGSDALDTKPLLKSMQDLRDKLVQKAANGDQARAFLERTNTRANTFYQLAEQHSSDQRKVYYKETADGQFTQAMSDAVVMRDQQVLDVKAGKLVPAVQTIIDHIKPLMMLQWVDNEKLPPEAVATRWAAAKSDLLASVAKAYIAHDQGIKGMQFLEDNREELGQLYPQLEAALRPIRDREVSDATAEDVYQSSFGKLPGSPDKPAPLWAEEELRDRATRQGFTIDQFNRAEQVLQAKMGTWSSGYAKESEAQLTSARAYWENAGHSLLGVPENLVQDLRDRGEWYKMEALDRSFRDAEASTPPSLTQQRNMARFMLDLAKNPYKYDAWTEEDFYNKVGWALHKSDREQAAALLARYQGRPERWTEGLKPIMNMAMEMAASKDINALPKLRDPDPKQRDPQTGNWGAADVKVFYEMQRRIQSWLLDWHRKPHNTSSPTQEEFQPFLEDLFHKGKDPDGGWFGSGPTTRIRAETLGTGYVPEESVGPETLRQIKESWVRNNPDLPMPTDGELVRAYLGTTARLGPNQTAPLTPEQEKARWQTINTQQPVPPPGRRER